MIKQKIVMTAILTLLLSASLSASSVSVQISGKGAINDSTIKVGEKTSIDIYFENDKEYRGFSLGFKMTSTDIKKITHVIDTGIGLNKQGDIKAYNGWENSSIWDLGGVFVIEKDWDGNLPELIGFGGVCKSKVYSPHKNAKNLSFDVIFEESGSITIDSSFFPPTGKWLFSPPNTPPKWNGPYKFNVIK